MAVYIGTKRLIPAPLISINKNYITTDDGRLIYTTFNLNLRGTLLPNRGSPTTTGWYTGTSDTTPSLLTEDCPLHDALLQKQELLREAFAQPGFKFSYQPTGFNAVECYPRVKNISFDPDVWVIKSTYSIDLEATTLNKVGTTGWEDIFDFQASGLFITRASDNWSIKERDDGTKILDITRNISATATTAWVTGIIVGVDAWKNAKTWVGLRVSGVGIETNLFGVPTGVSSGYNRVEEETIDKLGGSYSLSQRFIYTTGTHIEQRQVSHSFEPDLTGDGGADVERINVNGNIQGIAFSNLPADKLANALAYWNSISGTIGMLVGAYGNAINYSINEDQNNGRIDYAFSFVNNSGSIYKHVYDVNYNAADNGFPVVTIAGQIEGITFDAHNFDTSGNMKFGNAVSGWELISPNLKNLAFAYCPDLFGTSGYGALFNSIPSNKSIAFNKPNGTINYSCTFGYIDGGGSNNYLDQYTVELSTTNAASLTAGGYQASTTINGQIQGLSSAGDPTEKNNNAANGWTTVQSLLFTRCSGEYSKIGSTIPLLVNRPITRTVSVNRVGGSINYSTVFNNDLAPTNANVAIADVNIEDIYPQDVFAIQAIPGRAIGPIIQNIGTITEARRNINVSLVLYPKSGGNYWLYSDKATIHAIASGYFASGVYDLGGRASGWLIAGQQENFDPKRGTYTGNMNIVIVPTG